MNQPINRRSTLPNGLLASGGLAVLSQLGKAASPPHDVQKKKPGYSRLSSWAVGSRISGGRHATLALLTEASASARHAPEVIDCISRASRPRADIKAFMFGFRQVFPNLDFWGAADLIAEGDNVVGRWEGGGTHTGPGFQ